ncbi:MAG: hypothetical protein K6A81_05210 [Clostridiales bacterium]|nr:hypothetical protein [Clostridiales bacterium]
MLGDELKKALEPIQASDELLEKTRKAIEQARLSQAKETLAKTEPEKTVRSGTRNSFYWKAVIPVACAVLLFAGAILLLPKLFSEKKSDASRGRGEIQAHNDAIADVVKEIDDIACEATEAYVEESAVVSQESAATTAEAEIDGDYSKNQDGAEALESSDSFSLTIDPYYKNKNLMVSPNLTDRLSVKHSVPVGKYTLIISEDEKELYLNDTATGTIVENTSEHAAPAIRDLLSENETISGLLYDENYRILYISTVEGDTASTDSVHLFVCGYDDGKVTKDPERAG